jgi:hypothetical protein
MRFQLLAAVLAGAVLGSGCGQVELPSDGASSVSQPIIGGTVTMGDPAVVSMALGFQGRYQSTCTGTLIGPKTVITAAHCIYSQGQSAPYYAAFGTYITSPSSAIRVVNQVRHPGYNGRSNDFGLLQLERPVLNVPVFPLNDTPLTDAMLGRDVRHTGFGVTDGATQSGSGAKRVITTPLRSVMPESYESGAPGRQTCQGDSGGPGFMILPGQTQEKLIGIVSYGDQGCMQFGVDMRIDRVVPWIRQTMARWEEPTCEEDGLCKQGCAVIDQDCACAADGQCTLACNNFSRDPDCPANCGNDSVCSTAECPRPDPDCVPEGDLCSAPTQCQGRECINDSQNPDRYCTRTCATNTECVAGMVCADGVCRIPPRPERQLLESCVGLQDFCVDSTCNGPVGGITRCVRSCQVTNDCAGAGVCEGGTQSGRYCRPLNVDFQPKVISKVAPSLGVVAKSCTAAPGGLLVALVLILPALRRRRIEP